MSEHAEGVGTEPPGSEPAIPLVPRRRRLRPREISWLITTPIGLALLAFLVTRPIGPDPASKATPAPGATFYVLGAETAGIQVGQLAPDFIGSARDHETRLTDLDGKPVAIAGFKGHPLWIVFWATWCPPCQRETPDLKAAFEAHRAQGLEVLAISVQESPDTVRDFVTRNGLTYRIGLDTTGAVLATYGVFGLPTHYFVDRHGVIRDRNFGPLTRDQMEQRITEISEP
jgi:cytochrome c biogenesis protein CcmG/thiol:disulfide interchange protein DsbE